MTNPCPGIPADVNTVKDLVVKEYQNFVDRVRNLDQTAKVAADALSTFNPEAYIADWSLDLSGINGLQAPDLTEDLTDAPDYIPVDPNYDLSRPTQDDLLPFDDGSGIPTNAPERDYPDFQPGQLTPPTIDIPEFRESAPDLEFGDEPVDIVINDVPLPLLYTPNVPDAPDDADLGEFTPTAPNFTEQTVQDMFFPDIDRAVTDLTQHLATNAIQPGVRDALNLMVTSANGTGTGLAPNVEQALFDRARERVKEDEIKAIEAAKDYWASKGFELPGTTVLTRELEARHQGMVERGRINRELSINFHNQEIENLRFAVQQGLTYEIQLMQVYAEAYNIGRQVAEGHAAVLRSVAEIAARMHEINLAIYTSEIQVFQAQTELALQEIQKFRILVEAERAKADFNNSTVAVYEAQIRAELSKVDIYRGRIDAYSARIGAETAKIDGFRAKVQAYTAQISGETAKTDVFSAEVQNESARVNAQQALIDGYRARVGAYEAEVSAQATKTRSINEVVESQARIYATEMDGYVAALNAETRRIESAVTVFRGQVEAYQARLSKLEVDGRLKLAAFDKDLAKEQGLLQEQTGNLDRELDALRSATQLELQKLSDAARINGQLAAASMASLNLSAGLQAGDSVSSSGQTSCSTTYSASL
jgi:hypothetical protein